MALVIKLLIIGFVFFFAWNQYSAHAETQSSRTPIVINAVTKPRELTEKEKIDLAYQRATALSIVQTNDRVRYSDRDLFCLAKNIYHEAGNQSRLGKFAVAQVTINRMKHESFSDTVCGVVLQPYQFSWANNQSRRWTTPRNSDTWQESKLIARQTLEQGFRVKGMSRAMFFHTIHVNPGWRGVKRFATIGSHVFYSKV